MNVTLSPASLTGVLSAPPSKSMAHRALICAGLAQGTSVIRGLAPSQDVLATLDCLRALGAEVALQGDTATVRGTDPAKAGSAMLPCRESGSTLRFFLPLCLLGGKEMTLTGSRTLLQRPLSVYEDLFAPRGIRFRREAERICVQGRLGSGVYELDGSVSSQFITGLLLALPLAEGDSLLRLKPPVESRAYIHMTLEMLHTFGIRAAWVEENTLSVPGGQTYQPRALTVEGDWSNAAFFLAMGVPVTSLRQDSLQGDRICVEYFKALDGGRPTLDLSDCPDLGPVLFAYAALRQGAVFTGTRRLRFKESDRGAAMEEELKKFGVPLKIGENTVTVGCGVQAPREPLYGHNDHRIVMALAVLCCAVGGTITGAEAVNKSYPDFFDRLKELGGKVEISHRMDLEE